ncbi:uncharacterized protein NFIA_091250 [Aspergillus fischeri NRRL 181]|uniref:Myb-like DNA-binding domain-containing protein n=1 Tax=Neosartorya fischeri (strain ATCC 1020 / DSM 3700 / CBS 544.65 / FGSC A1164 / JCM 1740 / NRRL 181 / WB 181) TaxID=331117 RepID=A1DIF9_NEOFI|nr:conserved hypothetical protein [Aspergillus fischeri NRRL 181]EAW19166.1 conserved hypothetical protein [Aspergillus fischeri NRRL 181]KAG2021566.1 hypothetical protein GB937_004906 [Aspergillus fischeri]
MPKSTLDEQHIFMYHILNGVNDKTIDWDPVCKATSLNKKAAKLRWVRLKAKIEGALKGNETESADDIAAKSGNGNGNAEVKPEAEKAPGKAMPKMGVFKPRRSKNVNTAESEIAPPAKKRRTSKRNKDDQTDSDDANKGASEATAEK